jgi:hypothetical protein
MSTWVQLLAIAILLSTGSFAQQPPLPLEEGITSELKSDSQVSEAIRSLRSLRKRLDAMGSKHPSRKQFEDRIKSQEETLRDRIQKLTPSVEPKEDRLLMEPKREGSGGSLDLTEPTTHPGFQDDSNKTISDADSDRQKSLVPTTQGVTDLDVPQELDARIIEQNAYPWLDNKEIQDSGCFPRTRLMWGIEPIYDRHAKIESGVVWEWNDTWRAKTLSEFWRSPKPLIAFHPSKHFDSDGLSFAVCKDTESSNPTSVELWIIKGRLSDGSARRSELLCKGMLGDPHDRLSLYFDPIQNNLTIGVCGRLELIEKKTSVEATELPEVGVIIQISALNSQELQNTLVPFKEPIVVKSESIVTSVAEPHNEVTTDMRPFWRKKGAVPSQFPHWWGNRGTQILKHDYDPSQTSEANGSSLWKKFSSLVPGDMLMVQPGVYSSRERLDLKLNGTANAPIVIEAQGAGVVITRPDPTENVINITDSTFFALGGIEVTGGSTGVRIQTASELMIYNSTIYDVGNVGISLNLRNTSSVYLVDNEIFGTKGNGEGIYAGSHDGTRTTHDSFFVGNYIHDLAAGPESQGDGIEIKNRSYGNTVKWNYIVGTKYPGVTVYGAGQAGMPINIIQENIILNSEDSGIQVTADALVQGNWISGKNVGIASRPFGNTKSRNVKILGNTIITDTFGIKVSQWNHSDNWIANNLISSKTRNYFHSGFGRAIYLSNQLVCNLEDATELEKKTNYVSNRLLTSNDLFDNKRSSQGRVGAIEYLPDSRGAKEERTAVHEFSHAIYQPVDSQIQFWNQSSDEGPRTLACLTDDLEPINVPDALVQVAVVSDPELVRGGVVYRIMIADRSSGKIFWAEAKTLKDEGSLLFKKRDRLDGDLTGIGVTTNAEILLIDRNGLSTVSVR